ncbi:MAG: hypothetical protein CMP39_01775 [Rickettsiales bacterium]|nr:hypothetical protein [Rickettsiales bacterium]|tara:strand:- start:1931 stop:2188 length:258 start_codon:yes stop_codon:yes gene_type:complete
MFSKLFKVLVGLSFLFGFTKNSKSKNSTKKLNHFDFMDEPSDNFIDATTNKNPQDSVTFIPSQKQSKDVNNNFNQQEDEEILSPG